MTLDYSLFVILASLGSKMKFLYDDIRVFSRNDPPFKPEVKFYLSKTDKNTDNAVRVSNLKSAY
jgi:hypothetical protein